MGVRGAVSHPAWIRGDGATAPFPSAKRSSQHTMHFGARLPAAEQKRELINYGGRGKSLVLYGPTRTGKTQWARSLGRHCYHNGQFNPDIHSDGAQYAIFDDLKGGFKCWPSYKQWLGQQKEFTITGKYFPLKTITWGKPCIYIANVDPRMQVDESLDLDWLDGNCVFIHVENPLY